MGKKLEFKKIIENKNLVSLTTYNCIESIFSEEEKSNILVALIDSKYMDGMKLCEKYNIDPKNGSKLFNL